MLHYQCCLTWLLHNTVSVFPKLFFHDDDDDVCKQLLIASDDNISPIFISGGKTRESRRFLDLSAEKWELSYVKLKRKLSPFHLPSRRVRLLSLRDGAERRQ